MNRKTVVKRLALGGTVSWKDIELFEREAQTLAALDHPGIPKLLDVIEEADGTRLLVLEYVPGKTLAEATQDGTRLGREHLTEIVIALLAVLQYLHELTPPVVHRDIKPDNIVIGENGRVVLIDFGSVAKARRGETTVGTFGYMAPEQLHGEARPESDLYALGMTILAVATGCEPEDLPRRGLIPIVSPNAVGERLAGLVSRMIAHEPSARPQSAVEVKAALSSNTLLTRLPVESSMLAMNRASTVAPAPHGAVGTMVRRDVRSASGMSAVEWAVVVSIPIAAVAGFLGLYWLMLCAPAILAAGALAWRRHGIARLK